ncbi:unnamed protein product [Didymodactylos carnosus]|uniref:Uncharacterized protein n=1 Tax=Didymodactylos carnosus TaxID=1234261 RepID=A0A816BU18_9BILA|nr:unnamed protein product [Didymodactylos carnosus]CAF4497144.1 unnamed protein product [Didymodactylos carnosus]
MKNLVAQCFVPPDKVVEEFTWIKDSASDNLDGLIMYFEDTYVGRIMNRNRRAEPRFHISMWNCFERIEKELARTTNAVEGWHNSFHVTKLD